MTAALMGLGLLLVVVGILGLIASLPEREQVVEDVDLEREQRIEAARQEAVNGATYIDLRAPIEPDAPEWVKKYADERREHYKPVVEKNYRLHKKAGTQ